MKTLLLSAAAAAAILGAGAAFAQTAPVAPTAPQAMRMNFAKPETRAEVQTHVAKMFARLDTNHDGFVTREETQALHAQMAAKMQQRMAQRAQNPGADRSKAFDRIDANHDGMISRDEFASAPRPQGMMMRMAGMHRGLSGQMFEMADLNKDGRVSLAEAQQAALQHFDRADLNHDGTLSPEERQQAHQLMRADRHPS
jgi:Ca2+-binding EF-hand superfamily protein